MNALLLWAALAFAQTSPSTPAPSADPAADPACAETPALLEALRLGANRDAWLCLAQRDEAGPALLQAIGAGGPGTEHLTRALALWRMQRLDERLGEDEARALSPADRRLLRDAVQARRGRASPAPEHAEIFAWFSWYKPSTSYVPSRLTDLDKENMALIDRPPKKPAAAPPAAAAMEEAEPTAPVAVEQGICGGCASGGGGGLGAAGLALALAVGRRRRS